MICFPGIVLSPEPDKGIGEIFMDNPSDWTSAKQYAAFMSFYTILSERMGEVSLAHFFIPALWETFGGWGDTPGLIGNTLNSEKNVVPIGCMGGVQEVFQTGVGII